MSDGLSVKVISDFGVKPVAHASGSLNFIDIEYSILALRGGQTAANCEAHQARHVVNVESFHQLQAMCFHGFRADFQFAGDALRCVAIHQKMKNFALSRRQFIERIQAQMNLFLEDALLFAGHHDLGVKIYPIVEQDQALYLVCKHPQKDLKTLERVKEFWRERLEQTRADFYLTSNDNNVALLPNCITKRAAVEYVLNDKRARDEYLALGIGDSLSDLGFMDVCDFWITPRGSQIAKQLGM